MIKSRITIWHVLWYLSVAVVSLTLIGSSKQGALSLGVSESTATLLVGLVSVANGSSRVAYGAIFDRFGLVHITSIVSFCVVLATASVLVSFVLLQSGFYIFGALLMGFSYGGIPVVSSSYALSRFGFRYYATNYALATSCMIPSSLLSVLASSILSDAGGETVLYGTMLCVTTLGLGILSLFVRRYRCEMMHLF